MEQQTEEVMQVKQVNDVVQVTQECSMVNQDVVALPSFSTEENASDFAAYKAKEDEFKQYQANINRNGEIKQSLENEIAELKKQQSEMINKGTGTPKELTSISKDILAKQNLIDSYENAGSSAGDLTEKLQIELIKLKKQANNSAVDILKKYRTHVEGELLSPAIEQLRKVLIAQIKDSSCHPYMHAQISDRPVSEVLAERLGKMVLDAYLKNQNDEFTEQVKNDLSEFRMLDFGIIDNELVGSPLKLAALSKKHGIGS